MGKILILDKEKIRLKVCRIARQILEDYYLEKEIIIGGIQTGGFEFANRIAQELNRIAPEIVVNLGVLTINKVSPATSSVTTNLKPNTVNGKVVVVVDDVLNTGRTLIFGVNCFLSYNPKAIKTAVLVDRGHHNFPVKADYAGFTLATTLKENITVILNETESVAYLE
jgi:pyrimidine operon attenuation protein/uracil phosphoribosyltransferase